MRSLKGFNQQEFANCAGLPALVNDPFNHPCRRRRTSSVLAGFNLNGLFGEVGHGSDVGYEVWLAAFGAVALNDS